MATTFFYAQQTDPTDAKRRQNSAKLENRFPLFELRIKIELRDVSRRGAPRRHLRRRGRRRTAGIHTSVSALYLSRVFCHKL